jgi:hypothetical protein
VQLWVIRYFPYEMHKAGPYIFILKVIAKIGAVPKRPLPLPLHLGLTVVPPPRAEAPSSASSQVPNGREWALTSSGTGSRPRQARLDWPSARRPLRRSARLPRRPRSPSNVRRNRWQSLRWGREPRQKRPHSRQSMQPPQPRPWPAVDTPRGVR